MKPMNCLLITSFSENVDQDIVRFLQAQHVDFDTATDQLIGIQKAQQSLYDVVILNAEGSGYHIDCAIRILKECNPQVRIIVRTEANSRELETTVRKENIYYYHVNSFGLQEITTALSSALDLNKKRQDS
jgi:DNA-binding response OmpR family regulator